ncbi:MAG: sigma-E factor negative regulatory protein [Rugosibacter sp.]|jgi:sigma-E factor negative regulatory protein RseA|nr:sigma-E factor negative regulatory protein [Rugosibacter sp.]
MKTHISALMDGELEADEANGVVSTLSRDKEQKNIWCLYHVMGDAMRHEPDLTIDVSRRVMAALSLEPTILSPHPKRSASHWQRPIMALAASAAGVAVVAWVALAPVQLPVGSLIAANQSIISPTVPVLAIVPSSTTGNKAVTSRVSAPALSTVADAKQAARLQEYLMAHQAYEGGALVDGANHIRAVSVLDTNR